MSPRQETAALIALLRGGRRPWNEYAALVEERGSAREVHEAEPRADGRDTLFAAKGDMAAPDIASIEAEIDAWQAEGMRVVTVLDDEYPANLRTIHNLPPILFVRGSLSEADAHSVAVVGTRRASAEGLQRARSIAADLAERGYVVVSGLAEGIDTAAHTAALEAGGRTIAVIGTGVRRAYPKTNRALQERLAEERAR